MKKQFNMSIRSRLLLEFGLAALLTLAVAIVAIVNMLSLGENLSSMATRDRLLQTGSVELRLSVEQESDTVRGYLLTGDARFLTDFASAKKQYADKLVQLRHLVLPSFAATLLSDVDSLHASFIGIANEQSTLRDMGFSKAAVFLWQTQGNDIKSKLDGKLIELSDRQETVISGHAADARQQQNQTLIISLSLVLLTWIAVIIGWIWTSRSITVPISRLLTATHGIGMGELDTRVNVTGNDEFGTLGRAMNRMAEELSESRKTAGNLLRQEQRRADQMRTINEVGRQTSSILTLEELLPAVTDLLQRNFNYYNVNVFMTEPALHRITLKACRGGYTGKAPLGTSLAFGEGIVGYVVETGDTFLSNDVNNEPRYRFVAELADTRAELAVPIKSAAGVLGVLDIESTQVNAFDEADVFTVQTLADQLAVAVHNAQLYEKARELAALEERNRLARDLHDAVSQTLFSASLIADVLPRLWERNHEEGVKRLDEVRQLTRGALAEMRTLLLELRPSALVETELPHLLVQLGESISGRARVPVTVTAQGAFTFPTDVKVALYRIAQEALNNVAKYSGAGKANIYLLCESGQITLKITDNGRGFDVAGVHPDSLGLGIMRERAGGIGASLTVASKVGEGSTITVVWENDSKERKL